MLSHIWNVSLSLLRSSGLKKAMHAFKKDLDGGEVYGYRVASRCQRRPPRKLAMMIWKHRAPIRSKATSRGLDVREGIKL